MTHLQPSRRKAVWLLGGAVGMAAGWGPVQASTTPLRIAELKLIAHAALDADQRGFAAGLASAGFHEGQQIVFERQDANGDAQSARNWAQSFAKERFDLIHTIATLPSQEMVRTGARTSLVFSSVTDPVSAGIVAASSAMGQKTRTHITGVSDLWPVDLQFHIYARMVPQARIWGTIYNPAESNSVTHLERMHSAAKKMGLELIEAKAHQTEEVTAAAQSLVDRVHAITITSDNTAVSQMDALARVCNEHRIPLFAGDTDSVEGGAIAAYGMDYYLVGYAAGRKAALILKGVKPGEIPWGPMEKFSLVINLRAAKAQGVNVAPELLAKADRVIR